MSSAQPLTDSTVTAEVFADIFREHPAGVAVVTADAGDGPVAMTVTSVSSVDVAPPILMFSVSGRSSSAPTIRAAQTVVVHLLDADDVEIAKLAATHGVDRFADTSSWSRLPTGEPRYHGTRAWIRGKTVSSMDAGDATIIAVEALEVGAAEGKSADPLVYHARTWHGLGDHSKLDPTGGRV